MPDRIGNLLGGKYRVLRRLGAGGMGEVYEARHEGTERVMAVKVMRAELAARPEAEVRFDREARAAGRIGHEGICEVLDVGRTEDGLPFLVMPCLRGQSLAELLAREHRLSIVRCVDIAEQVLGALEAAHAVGVLHRDLKPANVFLTKVGQRGDFVKLLDFGVAGLLAERAGGDRPTRDGGLVGTVHYMSPEQVRGRLELDPRADLYVVGVLLYEMLTGRTPFVGRSDAAVLSAILLDPFPPPRALRPEVSPRLEAEVLRALSRDRERRHPDADTMRRALRAALEETGAPAMAVPAGEVSSLELPEPVVPQDPGQTTFETGDSVLDSLPDDPAALRSPLTPGPSVRHQVRRAVRYAAVALGALAVMGMVTAALLAWRPGGSAAVPPRTKATSAAEVPPERPVACAGVAEHLWRLADQARREGRQSELCAVLMDLDRKLGISWPAADPEALVCEDPGGGRRGYLPTRDRFLADVRSWCETGRIGSLFASRWSQRGIDCNLGVTRIEDVRRCWGL